MCSPNVTNSQSCVDQSSSEYSFAPWPHAPVLQTWRVTGKLLIGRIREEASFQDTF